MQARPPATGGLERLNLTQHDQEMKQENLIE
jgi:hypothetical protein